jgi:hypothetical protein
MPFSRQVWVHKFLTITLLLIKLKLLYVMFFRHTIKPWIKIVFSPKSHSTSLFPVKLCIANEFSLWWQRNFINRTQPRENGLKMSDPSMCIA